MALVTGTIIVIHSVLVWILACRKSTCYAVSESWKRRGKEEKMEKKEKSKERGGKIARFSVTEFIF